MAIAIVGTPNTKENNAGPATTLNSDAISMTAGSLIVVTVSMFSANTPTVADNVNGSYAQDVVSAGNANSGYKAYIFSKANVAGGSTTVTVTQASGLYMAMTVYELSGAATASALDAIGSDVGVSDINSPTATVTTTAASDCIIATGAVYNNTNTILPGTNFTELSETTLAAPASLHYGEYWLDTSTAGAKTVTYTPSNGGSAYCSLAAAAYKIAGGAGPSSFSKPLWPMSFF